MLSLFMGEAPSNLQGLQSAVKDMDAARLSRTAHGLRGVFATLGVENMSHICADLESAARANNWDRANNAILDFERSLGPLLSNVQQEVDLLNEKPP